MTDSLEPKGRDDPGDVLIVDDSPANLQVLSGLLKEAGHRVRPVSSGEMALRAARHQVPDIVLLDVKMPGMSGYEVCREFKADPKLADVPVLYISGLSEAEDKLTAFSTGCVDFVTKPFQLDEVKARVETHLRLRRLHLEVEQRNTHLKEANERLVELQGLRDGLVHMIVHDLRSPLTGIVTALHFLKEEASHNLTPSSRADLEQAMRSSGRLMAMINDLLDINRMEEDQMPISRSRHSVNDIIETSLDLVGRTRCANVHVRPTDPPEFVDCDRSLFERVLFNLIDNALKHGEGSAVYVDARRDDDQILVLIRDEGPGIPSEFHSLIFEKFGQLEARRKHGIASSGLGLAFCRMAVEAQGGQIGIESVETQGSTFWVSFPRRAGEPKEFSRSR